MKPQRSARHGRGIAASHAIRRGSELIDAPGIVYMIAGPHSGFSLDEIISMKSAEEKLLGCLFWGYGGSLCHPPRVNSFVNACLAQFGSPPVLVLGETRTKYHSATVGHATEFSPDKRTRYKLPSAVTMIGCTVAVVCRNLRRVVGTIDLNNYGVASGAAEGRPAGTYIRYQLNKACAFRAQTAFAHVEPRYVNVVAVADLVSPYCVYLSP